VTLAKRKRRWLDKFEQIPVGFYVDLCPLSYAATEIGYSALKQT
jgi:hypothetical protein